MRPVCRPSSSTDSSSSAESSFTSPSSTSETSSASRERIVSFCAIDNTVCASASATSRASPFNASVLLTVVPDQRAQLVLESACFDRAVDAALLRCARLPPPASGAQVLALLRRPGARRAADRGVALVVERVVRKLVLLHVVPHVFLRPLGERVELHDRPVVVVDLDLADVAARRPLVAAQAGDPRVEAGEVLLQRQDLAHLAAEQPVFDALVEEV